MRWMPILLLIGAVVIWHYLGLLPFPTPKPLAPDAPLQTALSKSDPAPWNEREFKIVPLARYDVTARLIHRESYWMDGASVLSPVDFVLGWGAMSDPTVYDKLNIDQGQRWYTWSWRGYPPIDGGLIPHLSANTHILPADSAVKSKLDDLRAGDMVHLTGYLVEISGANGWHWISSQSRDDTGAGACEVMWVKDAAKVGR